MNEQRSAEWFAERNGKFTGSQIHKLMTSGKKNEMFGKTALTYIREKVAEILTDGKSAEAKSIDTKATQHGNTYESEARRVYQEFTFYQVDETGFLPHPEIENFGASPDGLIRFIESGILEIKCPYNSDRHVDFLLMENETDLLDIAPEYYYQMQAEMMCAGVVWGDFVSYDPRCDERSCIKILRVNLDVDIAGEIKRRVEAANAVLSQYLERIYKQ